MATHTYPETVVILILPHKNWYNKQHHLTPTHICTNVPAHLDPHILEYSPQIRFPTYLTRAESKIIMILCIHKFRYPPLPMSSPRDFNATLKRHHTYHNFPNTKAPSQWTQPPRSTYPRNANTPTPFLLLDYSPPFTLPLPTSFYRQLQLKYLTTYNSVTSLDKPMKAPPY